ncbi:MAG: HlyC/CorC family transporter [Stomatobaculum sp.]|nr:HlyC/CorC family transporter [Stomatobaculum sp.]
MDSRLPGAACFILFLLMETAFFGFGAAIQNINTAELERKMGEGDRKAGQILRIVNRPTPFVNSIQIMILLTGFAVGAILVPLFARPAAERFSSLGVFAEPVSVFLVVFIAVVIMTAVGVVFPKRLAMRKPEKWAYKCLGPVRFFMAVFLPIRIPVKILSRLLMRLCGIDPDRREENVTEEDIMSMVNEGHVQGVVEADEAEMITNIFQLNDKNAADIMTHRRHVTGLDGSMLLRDAVDFLLGEGRNSRYPVYLEDIDNIIGVLNLKDAMVCSHSGRFDDQPLSKIPGLLREAHFIPETRTLDNLFQEMQSRKVHMMIVVDEYGQTSGIVTMEDILEEIVGNIVDEYDNEEEMITALPDGSFIMRGLTPLEDAADAAGIPFTEEEKDEFDTLNGFLISKADRIPADGERFTVRAHGYEFRILNVQMKMIRSVKVSWVEEEAVD